MPTEKTPRPAATEAPTVSLRRPKPGDVQSFRSTPPRGAKMADLLAHQIEREIIGQGWPVGSLIGTEASLLARYKVSRAVFREAVRILEHHTTARVRRGSGGGLVVAEPQISALSAPVSLYLEYSKVEPGHVFDARVTIELAAVELAARNLTESGIGTLRSALEAEEAASMDEFPFITGNLHVVIAELSGNPVYPLFVRLLTDLIDARVETFHQMTPQVGEVVRHAHGAIVDAIIRGDTAVARHRLRRHLEAIMPWMP